MRSQRAARLAYDVRHRKLQLPARFGESIHHVVRVFLQRIVDARLRCRLRSIVIDTEPAADIDVRDIDAELSQLRIVARDLLQSRLDVPDVSDLRSKMEMDQLDHIQPAKIAQLVDELHELCSAQAEFRFLTTALCPATRAFGMQLDAHAGGGIHSKLICHLKQNVDLAELFDDDEYFMPKLLPHEGETHELLILVSVAHNEMIGVLCKSKNRLQLGLAAALETNAGIFSKLDDLFNDVTLLIDLYRKDRGIRAGVFVLPDRAGESLGE